MNKIAAMWSREAPPYEIDLSTNFTFRFGCILVKVKDVLINVKSDKIEIRSC